MAALTNLGKKWFPCEIQYADFPVHIIIEPFENSDLIGNDSVI